MSIKSLSELEGNGWCWSNGEKYTLTFLNGVLIVYCENEKEGWESVGYAYEYEFDKTTDEINIYWKDTANSTGGSANATNPQVSRVKIENKDKITQKYVTHTKGSFYFGQMKRP